MESSRTAVDAWRRWARLGAAVGSLAFAAGVLAAGAGGCTRRTTSSPSAAASGDARAQPTWIAAAPVPISTIRELPLGDRCNLVATVLTEYAPAATDGGTPRPPVIEHEVTREVAFWRGAPVVAALVGSGDGGAESSLFAPGESCGKRLALLSRELLAAADAPAAYAQIALDSDAGGGFRFELTLAPRPGTRPAARWMAPLAGRLVRSETGEWDVFWRKGDTRAPRAPRAIDGAPRVTRLPRPTPPGRVEAAFEIDTGNDTLGASPVQAGLEAVVRYAATELRQTVASCDHASRGSALGGGDGVLDVAICGDTYRLLARPGAVIVERGAPGAASIVARLPLPSKRLRAVAPALPAGQAARR